MTELNPPRLSATIMLLRDAPELEVLMVERHYQIDFAAGALVFPGGKSVEDDRRSDWEDLVDGAPQESWDLVARITAIRETFEESGVLLARRKDARGVGRPLVGPDVAEAYTDKRGPVDRGEISFLDLIRKAELVLALDGLIHFGHWITPEMMPKRFDTHFYLAPAPPRQLAAHDGRETTDTIWLSPERALAMAECNEANIIFPTRMNLDKLSHARTVSEAQSVFAGADVMTVLPQLGTDENGEKCLHIPAAAGYCQTLELLTNVKV